MAEVTIESLKTSLLQAQTDLTNKITELNNAHGELTGLSQDAVINDILINGYTLAQYLEVHPPSYGNASALFIQNQTRVQKAIRAIQLQQILIPRFNIEIAALKEKIAKITIDISSFTTGEIKTTIAKAWQTLATGFANNLPLIIFGIIGIIAAVFGLRWYFKNKKAKQS